jgi:2-hydroxy-6-oxonona-2,4-dienedioate hydrolase
MNLNSLIWNKNHADYNTLIAARAQIRSIPIWLKKHAELKTFGQHAYIEIGKGKPIVFSHGIFGGLYNIGHLTTLLKNNYKIFMPFLPMYDAPLKDCTIEYLGKYLAKFINDLAIKDYVLLASSMGGGASIEAITKNRTSIKGLVLCGSSGISAIPLAKGYFKRKSFDFIFETSKDIFFNRAIPEIEMAKDVFNCIQHFDVLLRAIRFTKSTTNTKQHNLIANIKTPTLLIWGKEDPITPIDIGYEFNALIQNSELIVLNQCGHVPTQEHPQLVYNALMPFFKTISF